MLIITSLGGIVNNVMVRPGYVIVTTLNTQPKTNKYKHLRYAEVRSVVCAHYNANNALSGHCLRLLIFIACGYIAIVSATSVF